MYYKYIYVQRPDDDTQETSPFWEGDNFEGSSDSLKDIGDRLGKYLYHPS